MLFEIEGTLHRFLCVLHRFTLSQHRFTPTLHHLRSLYPRFPLFHRYLASQPDLPSNLLRDRHFLLLFLSPAIAEFAVRVHMVHLPTPNPRLAPLPFFSFFFVLFFPHSLLKQLPRGLEHPEASFVPTVHPFALAHAADFGGKRSVDDGKRRSATLLARTCSGFYVSLIALSHLAVIAALRRIGFPLLPLTFSRHCPLPLGNTAESACVDTRSPSRTASPLSTRPAVALRLIPPPLPYRPASRRHPA